MFRVSAYADSRRPGPLPNSHQPKKSASIPQPKYLTNSKKYVIIHSEGSCISQTEM